MAVIYIDGGNEDFPSPVVVDDDSTSWWAGTQQCFASVAIAAALAIGATTAVAASVVAQPQDELPSVAFQPDEDYWQSSLSQPIQTTIISVQTTGDAGSVAPIQDEDFSWPQPPPWPISQPLQPFLADHEYNSSVVLGMDEDYWSPQLPPKLWPQPQLPFIEAPDGGPVIFGLDEDYSLALIQPVVSANVLPAQWSFDTQDIAVAPADEAYWQNAVAPIPATFARLYLPDSEEIPAGTLYGQYDEDFAWPQIPPVVATNLRLDQWPFDQNESPTLYGQYDEDLWVNPVPPVPASLYQRLPLGDPEELPAGSLYGQPDEYVWQNAVPPVAATLAWPQPWSFDAGEIAYQSVLDEDFWTPQVQPQQWSQPSQPFAADDGFTPFQPDEDLWQNPVAPVFATFGKLYLPDPEELPAATLSGQPDEDFWANPVPPLTATLAWPQPWVFDQDESPTLEGQLDEDFWYPQILPQVWVQPPQPFNANDECCVLGTDEDLWVNPVAPVQATLLYPQQWAFDEELPALFRADEDFWFNPAAPTVATNYLRLPFTDPEEIPALYGQPDEDFWQNPVQPIPATLLWPQPWNFEQNEVATLSGQPDEDLWQNPTAPIAASLVWPQPFSFDQDEQFAGLHGQPDEDLWSPQIPPQPWGAPPLVFRDDDVIVPQPTTFPVDEDFWVNAVAPVQASLYQRLPLGDPEELPAAALHGQPDEDQWVNPVPPTQASNLWPQQWQFDAEYPPSLRVDEVSWANPTPPVPASLLWPSPWQFDQDEAATGLYGQFDEDFWINSVAPVPASLYVRLPFVDLEELPAGSLHGQFDEDLWINPTPPVVASLIWPQPWSFDSDFFVIQHFTGDEDFWQNPVAPVPLTFWQSPILFGADAGEIVPIPRREIAVAPLLVNLILKTRVPAIITNKTSVSGLQLAQTARSLASFVGNKTAVGKLKVAQTATALGWDFTI